MSLAIISHPDCRLHDAGPHHPECADRLDAIQNQLISSGLDYVVRHYDAPAASRADLERVHDGAYLDRLFALGAHDEVHHIDDETVICTATLKAALRAAGAPLLGVDLVMDGRAGSAFCMVRPPGHHAEADRAMGFCLFNNVAVGAAYALEKYDTGRIAIIDFDVHHGNGT
ncbi:MAG: histone deacetylase family protein, partial [Hyphomicrobiales bacterium]|nr:histone deacetylase family protein [Hyphomicrobiales bacterium]